MTRPRTSLWQDRRGVAALETGLVTAFLLLPLLSGVTGAGQALMTQQRLDRALHAALMRGWAAPGSANASILQSAAQSGYGAGGATMTPTASIACYCITLATGARSNTTTACGTTCANGQVLGTYATVTASASFTPIITVTWGGAAWNLSATGTARIQ